MESGQTPRSEPQPEVIEEEEEFTEIQSDVHDSSPLTRSPIDGISLTPHPTRSPGARVGGVEGSPDSTSTSELGSAPTRLELQRQIKQLEGLKETAEVVAADGGGDVDVSVLYRRMDECLEKEEYAAATLIKERIDALTAGRG